VMRNSGSATSDRASACPIAPKPINAMSGMSLLLSRIGRYPSGLPASRATAPPAHARPCPSTLARAHASERHATPRRRSLARLRRAPPADCRSAGILPFQAAQHDHRDPCAVGGPRSD
jgi:hypothetical protein